MNNLDIRIAPGEKDGNYSVTANVEQFEMGIFVASGSTLESAFKDLQEQLIYTFKDRGISPEERNFSVKVSEKLVEILSESDQKKVFNNLGILGEAIKNGLN